MDGKTSAEELQTSVPQLAPFRISTAENGVMRCTTALLQEKMDVSIGLLFNTTSILCSAPAKIYRHFQCHWLKKKSQKRENSLAFIFINKTTTKEF